MPDTILWQPVIVLPADGKARVAFHLGNARGGYEVVVAGHTLDGRLARCAASFRFCRFNRGKRPRQPSGQGKLRQSRRLVRAADALDLLIPARRANRIARRADAFDGGIEVASLSAGSS